MKTKQIALAGVLCALASVLGYIESLIPPIVPVAGFKIGLSNIAVMYALYRLGGRQAFFVMLVKVIVTSVWFSGLSALIYSLAGGAAALLAMALAKKIGMSCCGVGMCGGVCHNIGQLLAACAVMETLSVLYWAPALMLCGLITGFLVGTVTLLLIKYTKHSKDGNA